MEAGGDDAGGDGAVVEVLLEDRIAVEGNNVDPAHLSKDVQSDGDERSVQVAVWRSGEGVARVSLLVQFNGVANHLNTSSDYLGVFWFVFKLAEDFRCVFYTIFGKKPSGEVSTSKQSYSGNTLTSETLPRTAPLP